MTKREPFPTDGLSAAEMRALAAEGYILKPELYQWRLDMAEAPMVEVPVKSPVASTINWAQAVGFVASLVAYFKLNITEEQIATIILGVQGIVTVYTLIRHTFFEGTVLTPSVSDKL